MLEPEVDIAFKADAIPVGGLKILFGPGFHAFVIRVSCRFIRPDLDRHGGSLVCVGD